VSSLLEYPVHSSNHLCQFVEETKESWIRFDKEEPLELKIDEFLSSPDPLIIRECDDEKIEEHDHEEFLSCLSLDILFTQEIT